MESLLAEPVEVDDFLDVRNPSATPILEALGREQAHSDQDINGGHDLAPRQYLLESTRDSWAERVVTKRVDALSRI